LAYIFVADSMGLSSLKFVQWALKDASFLRQSAFWPFKLAVDLQCRVFCGEAFIKRPSLSVKQHFWQRQIWRYLHVTMLQHWA